MRFSQKVFIGMSSLSVSLILSVTFFNFRDSTTQAKNDFANHYEKILASLGVSLHEMDVATEIMLKNSLWTVRESMKGNPKGSTEFLSRLKSNLSISSIDVINNAGVFVRSTNYLVKELPNLYDFCPTYRELTKSSSAYDRTPLMPNPIDHRVYKFALMPSADRSHILSVGLEVGFVTKILEAAMEHDREIVRLGLSTPNGTKLGVFYSPGPNQNLEKNPSAVLELSSIIPATVQNCCECRIKKLMEPNSHNYFYRLNLVVSLASLKASIANIQRRVAIASLVAVILALVLSRYLSQLLVSRLEDLNVKTRSMILSGNIEAFAKITGGDEVAALARSFASLIESLKASQFRLTELRKSEALSLAAAQVAHDIRSPLSALNLVTSSLDNISEEKRLIIRNAASRINDIANNLLARRKGPDSTPKEISIEYEQVETVMLSSLVDAIVSEKRIQNCENLRIDIEADFSQSYGLFVSVVPSELNRAISNLVNNAIEAIEHKTGKITIGVKSGSDSTDIIIEDNGKGIPANVLSKLGKESITFGKTGTSSGHGLGFSQAKAAIDFANGNLTVESEEGVGTTVTIQLPKVKPPGWFADRILVHRHGTLVSVDDDRTIHQIWANRLRTIRFADCEIRHLTFSSPDRFKAWLESEPTAAEAFFLIDHEFAGKQETGLKIISQLRIASRAILVSSRATETEIQASAVRSGVRLLPKSLASLIPLETDDMEMNCVPLKEYVRG